MSRSPWIAPQVLHRPQRHARWITGVVAGAAVAAVTLGACSSPGATATSEGSADKSKAEKALKMAEQSSLRGVMVQNSTDREITLHITGTDNFDWEGPRPDGNTGLLEGKTVKRTDVLGVKLAVNTNARSAPFTINVEGLDTDLRVELDTDLAGVKTWSDGWFGWKKRGEKGCVEVNGSSEPRPISWKVNSGAYSITVKESCDNREYPSNTFVFIGPS